VSSAAGKVPSPCQSVYAASKHAVNGYFHTLRSEVVCSHSANLSKEIAVFKWSSAELDIQHSHLIIQDCLFVLEQDELCVMSLFKQKSICLHR
jgi:hypothetical protein